MKPAKAFRISAVSVVVVVVLATEGRKEAADKMLARRRRDRQTDRRGTAASFMESSTEMDSSEKESERLELRVSE